VHRDLKLENIILAEKTPDETLDYKIKIIDWGCSAVLKNRDE
jgi:serine/threonine protein kinase